MEVTVEDGKAVAIRGGDMPFTAGTLCTKVARYLDRTYAPSRILYPMKRTGRKGEGRFARISWDEALDTIATRFKTIAAEDPQQDPARQLRRNDGPGEFRQHGPALFPPPRRQPA